MRDATRLDGADGRRWLISIHASHAGCDLANHVEYAYFVEFQSTHPMRDATKPFQPKNRQKFLFQSTHPMRDATGRKLSAIQLGRNFNPRIPCGMRLGCVSPSAKIKQISIHASHAGCDSLADSSLKLFPNFNPRIPCRMRPFTDQLLGVPPIISIHASHAGCDSINKIRQRREKSISIHASHAGCDGSPI